MSLVGSREENRTLLVVEGEGSGRRGSSVEKSEGIGKSLRVEVMEGLVAGAGSFWSSRGGE